MAEPALWMSNWLHRGRLEAMVDSRALLDAWPENMVRATVFSRFHGDSFIRPTSRSWLWREVSTQQLHAVLKDYARLLVA